VLRPDWGWIGVAPTRPVTPWLKNCRRFMPPPPPALPAIAYQAAHQRVADAVVPVLDVTRKTVLKAGIAINRDHEVVPAPTSARATSSSSRTCRSRAPATFHARYRRWRS